MTTIRRVVVFRDELHGRHRTELRYDDATPLQVNIDFGEGVVWSFARDVLVDGLALVAGLGDVSCWRDGWRLRVRLDNGQDTVLLWCTAAEAEAFLADTDRLVPVGTERLDLNADLDLLLLNGGAR